MSLKIGLLSATVLMSVASTAHAGFQFGVICQDKGGAQYLFSDAIVKDDNGEDNGFKNPSECLKGACASGVLQISGVTENDGFYFASKIVDTPSFTDATFVNKYGSDGVVQGRLAAGVELICSDRELLSAILDK